MQQIVTLASQLNFADVVISGIALALLMEAITLGLRFGYGLTANRHTAILGRVTRDIRVHHGYVGLLAGFFAWGTSCWLQALANGLAILAMGLVLSDVVHHFLVLWPLTGSHEFHLRYRREG